MSQPCVAICTPIADMMHPLTWKSIRELDLPRPYHIFDPRGFPVDTARNMIVAGALAAEPRVTHFMWIDADMTFEADAVRRLLAHELPIVGGLCYNRRHPYPPIVMRKWPDGMPLDPRGYGFVHEAEMDAEIAERAAAGEPHPHLLPVDAVGGAFLLVERTAMEKIAQLGPPFANTHGGEDVSFSVRATEAGFKLYVDTSVEVGHVGEIVVTRAFAQRNRSGRANPWTKTAVVTKGGLRILGDEQTPDGVMHRARYRWAVDVLSASQRTSGGKQIDRINYRVLDFGCGTGHGTKALRDAGFAARGFDPDEAAIAYGRERWNLGNAISVGERPGSYDAVVAFEVLEHLDAHPAATLLALLERAPIVIGSVPLDEPAGANPHHKWSGLTAESLEGDARIDFFGQRWDGEVVPDAESQNRAETPILLFVARRR